MKLKIPDVNKPLRDLYHDKFELISDLQANTGMSYYSLFSGMIREARILRINYILEKII